jgi:hypothetical protein
MSLSKPNGRAVSGEGLEPTSIDDYGPFGLFAGN